MPEIIIQRNIWGGFQVIRIGKRSDKILKDCRNEAEAVKWMERLTGQEPDNQISMFDQQEGVQ